MLTDIKRRNSSVFLNGLAFKFFLMSRRTAKIASQAEPADLVSALSEAAGSSASSAPIRATRGASAALLAKEVLPIPTPVATSSSEWDFALSLQWRRIPFRRPAAR